MGLDLETKIALVQIFYSNGRNLSETLRQYRKTTKIHKKSQPCAESTLSRLVKKFEATGSVLDSGKSGRPRVSEETIYSIKKEVKSSINPKKGQACSGREIGRIHKVSWSTVHKVLKNILHLYPYKVHRVHELKPADFVERQTFAASFFEKMTKDPSFLRRILWTDEAHFHLHGTVNNKNSVFWASENPHVIDPAPLHDARVTVWCGINCRFVLGPYFFENCASGSTKTITVTGQRYARMLSNFVIPQLAERSCLEGIVFQQDGAPPHTQKAARELLYSHFGDRVISRNFDFAWPARSPDLTPADYWLWGYVKSKVYSKKHETLSELKRSITSVLLSITEEQLQSAIMDLPGRLMLIMEAGGGHIEQ